MSRREYTQTVQPVSRVPEKIFGWLAWLSLFVGAILGLYQLLVNGNNPDFIAQLKEGFNQAIQKNQEFKDYLDTNNLTVDQIIPQIMNAIWGILAYLILPLIFGLIGLLKMKKRILAGVMLLIAGLLTTPLFFTFIFGFIPLFFFIAAILLFARKDKVITNADYYDNHREVETVNRPRNAAPEYVERDEHIERERNNDYVYDANDREAVYNQRNNDNTVVDNSPTVEIDKETIKEHHEQTNIDHDYNAANTRDSFDKNLVNDHDRVTYVDKTKDAVDERRDNYNKRNQ
ncbi:DUF4064 domain-containing protein [Macrococcus capreoli]